jgi:choline kinase
MAGSDETLIVLAAGQGSRLGPIAVPKWLLPIGGRSLAERQLSALPEGVLTGFAHRIVVTGFASETIEAFVKGLATPFRVLFNDRWRDLNNWYSLLVALDYLDARRLNGNVVLLNSDLIFDTSVVAGFFGDKYHRRGDIDILVDFDGDLTDEAMKVSCEASEPGSVTGIGKTGLRRPLGEDIGMWRLTSLGWRRLRGALHKFLGRSECEQFWYQSGLSSIIEEDRLAGRPSPVSATPASLSAWIEIDDQRDLLLAEHLVRSWACPDASLRSPMEAGKPRRRGETFVRR